MGAEAPFESTLQGVVDAASPAGRRVRGDHYRRWVSTYQSTYRGPSLLVGDTPTDTPLGDRAVDQRTTSQIKGRQRDDDRAETTTEGAVSGW